MELEFFFLHLNETPIEWRGFLTKKPTYEPKDWEDKDVSELLFLSTEMQAEVAQYGRIIQRYYIDYLSGPHLEALRKYSAQFENTSKQINAFWKAVLSKLAELKKVYNAMLASAGGAAVASVGVGAAAAAASSAAPESKMAGVTAPGVTAPVETGTNGLDADGGLLL